MSMALSLQGRVRSRPCPLRSLWQRAFWEDVQRGTDVYIDLSLNYNP